jgi:type I restriction enzyme S subunit
MELMKGYKQTEVGVIPEEWKLMTIDQIFEFHSTSNFSKAQMLTDGEIGCLHYGLIHSIPNNNYNIQNGVKYFVTQQQAKYEFIKEGDVVMVDASEDLSGVNKSIEVSGIQDNLYISGLHTYLLRDRGFFEKYFRGPILNSYFAKSQFYRLAVGMKVYGVSKQQLKTVLLPIPSKSEQNAIAEALLETDTYIKSLEKLIDKKRKIKIGVVQELLKPKKGWETKMLGEVFQITAGGDLDKNQFSKFRDEIYKYPIYSNALSNKGLYGYSPFYTNNGNSITVTARGEVGNANYRNHNYSAIGRVLILTPKNMCDCRFITEYINNKIIFAIESTGVPQLTAPQISKYEVVFPILSEQRIISSIIYEMENEINHLESVLCKTKSIKEGMIQNLLTGKIRLL